MKKILLLTILLLIPIVSADWLDDGSCEIDTDCIISRMLVNETTSAVIPDANFTIEIYFDNNSLWIEGQMDNDSSGYYNYTFNIDTVGDYPSVMTCNTTHIYDSANVSFNVSIGSRNYFYMFLILIPLLLFILGRKLEELSLIIISGFLLVIFAVGIFMGLFPGIPDNFISDGLSALLMAIGFYFMIRASINYVGGV